MPDSSYTQKTLNHIMSETRLSPCLSFICHKFCSVISLVLLTLCPVAYSLSFNKNRFDVGDPEIFYEGDGTSSFGSIELNIVTSSFRVGRAGYTERLHLWDSASGTLTDFTTRFSFTIDTNGSDGFAFYLAPVGYQIPPNSASASLGLFNFTTRVGLPGNQIVFVEFDTWSNLGIDPPAPVKQHIGINNNNISSLSYESWNPGYGQPQNVLITYNATTKSLRVFLQNQTDPSSNSISLSRNIDLMEALPEWVTIGFSAATGVYGERHTIHSWEFSSTLNSTGETSSTSSKKQRKLETVVVVVIAVSSFLVVAVGVSLSWLFVKKRRIKKMGSNGNANNLVDFDLQRGALPKRFYYQELVAATNGFANDRKLGEGGSGQVYKGTLSDLGRIVAVKRIFAAESENSERISINEVRIISRLIHRNLVQFIGWCQEKHEFLLVYEYMPNGSLDNHLFGTKKTLPWNVRYKVASGLASALHYLHEEAEQCVLHRDIKSANVLLDAHFSTKLGDFGVAKVVDPLLRTQMTGVVGTYGYLAPEYFNHGRATKESDIFSFGVVALEIACGKRTYLEYGGYHIPLVKWVWGLYAAGDILSVADERLSKDFDETEMRCLLIVGLWCTHPNDKERPKAGEVIKFLQFEAPLPELPHAMHEDVVNPTHGQANSIESEPITSSLDYGGR